MKQTVTESMFIDSFTGGYKDNFSYEGKKALFEWLEIYEEGCDTEFELDPIACCCEYTEYASLDDLSIAQAIANQSDEGLAQMSESDKELLVRIPLEENGTVGFSDNWGKYPVTILNGKHIFIIEKEGYIKRQVILNTDDAGDETASAIIMRFRQRPLLGIPFFPCLQPQKCYLFFYIKTVRKGT